jgi:hydrogenase maturation protease
MNHNITILGMGNTIYSDNGVGIRVVKRLEKEYDFPDNALEKLIRLGGTYAIK